MARIDSKVIFVTTSPRTPAKMIPEIALLKEHFTGKEWNHEAQVAFMELLREENFFNGSGAKDPAFSARDRINRAPKALGFVNLTPKISLTSAGERLISAKRTEDVFLRQLLKFQLPSPYHIAGKSAAKFCIKPYLELFRLVRHFGALKFDELMIFALQMTDYRQFDLIVSKIGKFRIDKANNKESYRTFKKKYISEELKVIYADEISKGETKTRENSDTSLDVFIATKTSNMRDYADACIRYLRATGMVNISHVGRTLSIVPEKQEEVDYFLEHIDREPCFLNDEAAYSAYLGNADLPVLWSDNKSLLIARLKKEFPNIAIDDGLTIQKLKDALDNSLYLRQQDILYKEVEAIKDMQRYDDIQNTFAQISDEKLYDIPLVLEWNVWRAMTMLDGGDIKANLKFDDFGNPMSTAQGNMPDIVCDYDGFDVTVEVTTASGQRQYEMEGEPVARHLGKLKKSTGKETYCLFIAPTINQASIAHFFMLQQANISYYGGKSTIVPLELSVFQKMVEDSYKASYTPNPTHVEAFFKFSQSTAQEASSEMDWYDKVKEKALHWLD
ncbi:MAG TPA: AlwI family type II restriction endonuclease [Parabacteroides sp.]|nr:AlwI family type II restriction endonuclease [Parabacteroides sp.]